uniref:Thioredoxin n=1 Tax=Cyanea capillata TaxID=27804 RepID=A0A059TE93_CYACP|nr:thioredoxin [Cyanea capillata]
MVREIKTKAEFDELLNSTSNLIVVDFFATWCGPCKMISPKIEEFSNTYGDVVFVKVDVDNNTDTSEACGISAMPTFHLYKGGKKVDELVGASAAKLEELIKSHK